MAGMLNIGVREAQAAFFDRAAVVNAMDKTTRRVFSGFGAFVRQRAITLLLRHKVKKFGVRSTVSNREGTAPAGQPPFLHTGALARFLFFAFDKAGPSVVIGPALLKSSSTLDALEEGGQATISIIRRDHTQTTVRAMYAPHPFMAPSFQAEIAAGTLDRLYQR